MPGADRGSDGISNYFKMEDATRDDKMACSDVTISDSTKTEAEYKDVYAYLEKNIRKIRKETVHTLQTGQDY